MRDQIYIAGKLNGESAPHYIRNVHQMSAYAETIRKLGVSVHNPANDLIHGIIDGCHEYDDYWDNNLSALLRADALALVDNWRDSKGAIREHNIALEYGIPILYSMIDVKMWINRPKILAVVGESGSGKTMGVDYIERKYEIPMVRSYTDRAKRSADEDGHTFLSSEEFSDIKKRDMLAFTEWEEKRYCCVHSDIRARNTYVIDERGLSMLRNKWKDRYKVEAVRVHRNDREMIDNDRVSRDLGKFILHDGEYQYIVHNDGTKNKFYANLDKIVGGFFYDKKV